MRASNLKRQLLNEEIRGHPVLTGAGRKEDNQSLPRFWACPVLGFTPLLGLDYSGGIEV